MTTQMAAATPQPRRLLRSAASVFLGFVAVVVLSLGIDQVLHELNVYPPWGQPMHEPALNLLALSYRCVATAGPSYSLADITIQITVEFAKWARLPIPESCPHLARWFVTVSARPSAKA